MAITKTNFMRGMQCPKMLWLDKHKPSLKVIPPEVQQRLDEGNEFGDKAMAMFGPYEEMTIYKPSTNYPDTRAMVEKTKEHLKLGTPIICEAAFMDYNNYCDVDILRKTDSGYDMYEVKDSRKSMISTSKMLHFSITLSKEIRSALARSSSSFMVKMKIILLCQSR